MAQQTAYLAYISEQGCVKMVPGEDYRTSAPDPSEVTALRNRADVVDLEAAHAKCTRQLEEQHIAGVEAERRAQDGPYLSCIVDRNVEHIRGVVSPTRAQTPYSCSGPRSWMQ